MATRHWTRDMAVGVAEIDRQHRELFDRLKVLVMAAGNGNGGDAPKLLDDLARGFIDHFAMEERLMVTSGYTGSNSHCLQHQAFLRQLGGIRRAFQKQKPTPMLILEGHRLVGDWLADHIRKGDRPLATFLAQSRAKQPAAG